jgi:exonuclease III
MKGIFWNSRGLGDLAKHEYLEGMVKEEQIDFIALMETGRDQFSDVTLKNLCGGKEYIWHCMAPHGHSEGILLCVNLTVYDTGAIGEGDFYVKFTLRNKNDGFKWSLFAVYGPAQQQDKELFLTEMANVCSKETLPYIIGGDFNILRRPEDKNKDNFDSKWPNLFNMVIQSLDIREIEMSGRQYTWVGSGDDPTFEKLDRVLVSTEWEQKFPLTTVHAKDRSTSDHTSLLLNTSASSHNKQPPPFKFE